MDQKARPAHIDGWRTYIYIRWKIPGTLTPYILYPHVLVFYIIFQTPTPGSTTPSHCHISHRKPFIESSDRTLSFVKTELYRSKSFTVRATSLTYLRYICAIILSTNKKTEEKFHLHYERTKLNFQMRYRENSAYRFGIIFVGILWNRWSATKENSLVSETKMKFLSVQKLWTKMQRVCVEVIEE